MIAITATSVRNIEGSLITFQGTTDDGDVVTFAADHRAGMHIAQALAQGDQPVCVVEEYMILARTSQENLS